MKQYIEYMDNIKASDTLHQRLLNLETPKKRPAAWKKYGAVAAALALVAGVGVFPFTLWTWGRATASLSKRIPRQCL